jgi:hypothetical protein
MTIPLNGPDPYLDGILRLAVAGPGEQADGPVKLGTPLDVHCSQCDRAMRALVDLDLRDPRLSFVLSALPVAEAASAERLRIPACEQCSGTWFIYTDVDTAGGARNARVRPRPRREGINPFTREKMVQLGSDDKVPADSRTWKDVSTRIAPPSKYDGTSTDLGIGGTIFVWQEWEWPACMRCEGLMTFVASVAYELDGMCYYGFWCPKCGVATTYSDVD